MFIVTTSSVLLLALQRHVSNPPMEVLVLLMFLRSFVFETVVEVRRRRNSVPVTSCALACVARRRGGAALRCAASPGARV
jgi:hypothetical protein